MSTPHRPLGLQPYEAVLLGEQFGDMYEVYDDQGKADCEALIKRLGGTCVEASDGLRYSDSDLLSIYSETDFKVFFGRNHSIRLDNLLFAQALGHYELHFLLPNRDSSTNFSQAIFKLREDENNPQGVYPEAYNFALGLTMNQRYPEWQLDAANGNTDGVSDRLNVPEFALRDRLRQMGFTSPTVS